MAKTDKTSYTVTISPLPESSVEIVGEIPWEHVATFESPVVQKHAADIEVPGFRKGNAPEAVVRKQLSEQTILIEMAERAINDVYPHILHDHSLDVIGRPEVSITKLARNNPLGFTIKTAVVPSITLPDYAKIALSIAAGKPKDITEEDISKVVEDLRQIRAYGHVHHDAEAHEHAEPLPEVTDEFAQSFGNFKTVQELRDKVKENLTREALQAAHDKRRIAIMEELIRETSFDVPTVVTDAEVQKMFVQLEADVARSGGSMDDYLKHINKTRDQLLQEFRPEAEKNARVQLILNAIAQKAHIAPTETEIEQETQKLIAMYPGADHSRTRAYAEMMLTNEKTFAHIESK